MGKGEIARYEQFLLFPQCFQKACFPGASKGFIVWEWVNTVAWLGVSQTQLVQLDQNQGYHTVSTTVDEGYRLDSDPGYHSVCQLITLSQTTNFTLFEIETVCRQQF